MEERLSPWVQVLKWTWTWIINEHCERKKGKKEKGKAKQVSWMRTWFSFFVVLDQWYLHWESLLVIYQLLSTFSVLTLVDLYTCRPVTGLISIPSLSICKLNMLELGMQTCIDCNTFDSFQICGNIFNLLLIVIAACSYILVCCCPVNGLWTSSGTAMLHMLDTILC